jgi:hypothetical protein
MTLRGLPMLKDASLHQRNGVTLHPWKSTECTAKCIAVVNRAMQCDCDVQGSSVPTVGPAEARYGFCLAESTPSLWTKNV